MQVQAKDLLPGDWLMIPFGRNMRKDRPIESVQHNGPNVVVNLQLGKQMLYRAEQVVAVERTAYPASR